MKILQAVVFLSANAAVIKPTCGCHLAEVFALYSSSVSVSIMRLYKDDECDYSPYLPMPIPAFPSSV
jgi:hypothetical protein